MYILNVVKAEIVNPTVTRLLKTDLLHIEGKELNVVTIQLAPGSVGRQVHHPGPELVYVLDGVGVLEVEGKPPFALSPGAVTIVDSHHIHISKNTSPTHRLKLLVVQLLEQDSRGLRRTPCLAELGQ
ncbi:MAG TPA: cupin domain-containing protein [Nitrospiraceae bacterium]|jgi:quercetin dioxygenase-like cupin family protein|nr:cupin domain-containing protein [Nitrospiraceae bacterium]